jgi:hypothetical protein
MAKTPYKSKQSELQAASEDPRAAANQGRQAEAMTPGGVSRSSKELRRAAARTRSRSRSPKDQVVVAKMPLTQLIAPGFDGTPVSSGTTMKKLNLIAGLL